MANSIVRAAVVQAAPVIFDTRRTIAKLVDLAEHAAAQRADIVVFPEAFVGGYPKGLDFGARLGMRSPEGREDFRRYYESAITRAGDARNCRGCAARPPASGSRRHRA
jgi:nitrilase